MDLLHTHTHDFIIKMTRFLFDLFLYINTKKNNNIKEILTMKGKNDIAIVYFLT